jgi:hypothetical protein
MRVLTARWVAGCVAAGSVTLIAGGLALMYMNRHLVPAGHTAWNLPDVFGQVVNLAVPVVGFVLASRRPANRIGWLFLVAGLAVALQSFSEQYGLHALVAAPGSLPAGRASAWLSNWIWVIPPAMLAFLFLLFPTGQLCSRRWRPAAWFVGAVFVIFAVDLLVEATRIWPDPFSPANQVAHPPVRAALFILPPAALVVSVAAVVVRFARSSGEERLQLKWFAAAALLVVATFIPYNLGNSVVVDVLQNVAFLGLWVAIGIAVLKYRLYEIDIVISKAVLYGSLAVFITAVYAGLVAGVGTLVGNRRSALLSAFAAAVVGGRLPAGPPVGRAAGEPGRVRQPGHPVSGAVRFRPAHRRHLLQRGGAAADGADRGGGDRCRAGGRVAAGRRRTAPRSFCGRQPARGTAARRWPHDAVLA